MSSNPRKFAEKIANIQRKAEEEKANFESVMSDVQRFTKKQSCETGSGKASASNAVVTENLPTCQPGPSGSLTIPATGWRGGSLPNVHEMVHPTSAHQTVPINIQTNSSVMGANQCWIPGSSWQEGSEYTRPMHTATPRGRSPGASHYHPYHSPRGYSPTGQAYMGTSRERLYSQSNAQGYTMVSLGQGHQQMVYPGVTGHGGQLIPLPAGQFLQLPDQSGAWRRTHSDPGIHHSIVGVPGSTAGPSQRSPVQYTHSTGPVMTSVSGHQHQQQHTPTTARSSIGSNDSPLTDMSSPPQHMQDGSQDNQQYQVESSQAMSVASSMCLSDPSTAIAGGSLPDLPNTPNRQHLPAHSHANTAMHNSGMHAQMGANASQRHSIQLPVAPGVQHNQHHMQQQHLQAATPPAYQHSHSSNEHSPSASEPNSPAVMQQQHQQQSQPHYDNLNQQFRNISMSSADWAAIGQLQKNAYQTQMASMVYTNHVPRTSDTPASSDEQPMDMTKVVNTGSPGQVPVPNIILTDAHGNQAANSNAQQPQLSLDIFSDIERNLDENDLQRLLNEQVIDADSERELRLD